MGSRRRLARSSASTTRLEDHDAFVEACVQALERRDLGALVRNPPTIAGFFEAYILSRCLPIAMVRRANGPDCREEEQFDEKLGHIAQLGDQFLNQWSPRTMLEAALMLDAYDWDDDPNESIWRAPGTVKAFLLDSTENDPMSLAASVMLAEFSTMPGTTRPG